MTLVAGVIGMRVAHGLTDLMATLSPLKKEAPPEAQEELLDLLMGADSGPSRTVIPTHRGQRSGDCGQFLTSV